MSSTSNYILRLCFTLIIQKVLRNDSFSIYITHGMTASGICGHKEEKSFERDIIHYCVLCRSLITKLSMIVIPYFLFSIDSQNDGNVLN